MNKLKLTLLIFALLILPIGVFAESDSSGENGGSAGIVNSCSPNCQGIVRSSSLAGVRITFVDAAGNAVAASGGKSYDFVTYVKAGKENIKTTVNGFGGDRNKVALSGGGNYSASSTSQAAIPRFSAVIAAYNAHLSKTNSPHRSTLNTTGNTGGNLNGFDRELEFFLGLTTAGNPYYVEDVNSFINAVAEVTGGYNASDLIYEVAQGCASGDEIFIVMEPILFWSGKVGDSYQNYFGTLADSYHFFDGQIINALESINNMAYLIYYQREIPAYKGVTGVAAKQFKLQSGADLLSTAGFGIAVDWANDPGEYCGSCTFIDGKFSYDNKLYPGDLRIPSGFSSIQHFAFAERDAGGAGCCDILGGQIDKLPGEWQSAYEEYCAPDTTGKCCEPGVQTTPELINVNNCCTDSTHSEIAEVDLDDLFCYSEELKVDYYFPKCNSEYYLDELANTNLNEYCQMYCTERVSVDVPGAITAKSGRYFKLTTTVHGTTSPYIEGYKRCRTVVSYDKWLEDYKNKVKEEIKQYNEFQYQTALQKTYENAEQNVTTVSGSVSLKVSCETWEDDPNCTTGNCSKIQTCSNTKTGTYNYSYKKYHFTKLYDYYPVDIDDKDYTLVTIKDASKKTIQHAAYSTYNLAEEMQKANAALESLKSQCGCSSVTATRDPLPDEHSGYPNEDVPALADKAEGDAKTANSNYKSAASDALTLEDKLYKCDNYFTEDPIGSDAEASYEFKPNLTFSYSQVYLDEVGQTALDRLYIGFEKNCTYETIVATDDSDPELSKPEYSGIYSQVYQYMTDFRNTDLTFVTGPGQYTSFLHETYEADKKFTQDAKYHVVCKWEEKDNEVHTLVPSGEVSESITFNYTKHDKEYRVYLTTYDGTYQTYWDVSGLGTEGKFDTYFLKNGKSCAAENPADSAMFTCKLHIEHELIFTGKCNGSNGTDTTVNKDDCDPNDEGFNLFQFKVVEPGDFFPTGTTDVDGKAYAYNWTSTDEGIATMAAINEKAVRENTYAPDNISYSFTLTPTDMRHIKNYNVEKNAEGGYTDFNLYCECEAGQEQPQTNSMENGIGCTQCKSYFLENLEDGFVKYDRVEHDVNVWATDKKIETIRNNANWAGVN